MSEIQFETERLIIRKFNLKDAEFVFSLLNEPEWIRFIGDRKINSIEDAKNYIVNKLLPCYEKLGFGSYVIELKKNGQAVGITCLIKRDFFEHIDLGYALLNEYTGRGFAFEAAKATQLYAHTVVKTGPLIAITNSDNIQSIKLLNKLGFILHKQVQLPGEDIPLLYYTETTNP